MLFAQATPTEKDAEFMVYPRLPVLAEVGWTPKGLGDWDSLRTRLAEHARRWDLWGVEYYRSPQIPWPH
jgi:hexosaminidase